MREVARLGGHATARPADRFSSPVGNHLFAFSPAVRYKRSPQSAVYVQESDSRATSVQAPPAGAVGNAARTASFIAVARSGTSSRSRDTAIRAAWTLL